MAGVPKWDWPGEGRLTRACVVCAADMTSHHHAATICSPECRKVRQRAHRSRWGMKNRERISAAGRKYREANSDRYSEYQYLRRYGLTFPEVEALWNAQGGLCGICHQAIRLRGEKGRDKAVVDHCHATGEVRGLLCTPCNLMIGYASDNPETLRLAISYLVAV